MRAAWLLWVVAGALLEGVGLGRPERGDTLSEQAWWLLTTQVGPYVLVPLYTWLGWHLFLRPRFPQGAWQYDVLSIAIGLAGAYALTR